MSAHMLDIKGVSIIINIEQSPDRENRITVNGDPVNMKDLERFKLDFRPDGYAMCRTEYQSVCEFKND